MKKTIEKIDNYASVLTDLYNGSKVMFLLLNGYNLKYTYKIYNSDEVCIIIPFKKWNSESIKERLKKCMEDFKDENQSYDLKIEINFYTKGVFCSEGQLEINLSIKEKNKPKFYNC